MALRYYTDRIDASRVTRTPAGLVRVDASVAKAGVYSYRRADGTEVKEYLPAEELQREDSLASLEDATVTNRHPSGAVDAKNWAGLSIGHARNPRVEGTGQDTKHVATLVIARQDAQDKLGGELVEVSRGVRVEIDLTPGVTPWGERYDAIQRNPIYNHVAVGPRGWGRQGPDVALRLDAAGDEITPCCASCAGRKDEHLPWDECMAKAMKEYGDEETAKKVCGSIKAANDAKDQHMKITHKGKVYEFKSDSEAQAFVDGLSAETAAAPAVKPDPEVTAKLAAETARADAAQARLDAIEAQARKDARVSLETKARGVLGSEHRFDSASSDRDVRLAALAKLTPEIKYDGRSDVYVEAAFDHALASAPPAAGVNRSDEIARGLFQPQLEQRTDGKSEDRRDAQERARDRSREAYRKPLSLSLSKS